MCRHASRRRQTLRRHATLTAILFVTVMPCVALAQASTANTADTLDEIVVVAHKRERSIRDVAAHVTVIGRKDLDDRLAVELADVLRYSPGIDHEAAGTRFGTEGINIRGIGGNRVALLIDGVPLSDQIEVGSFSNATRDFLNTGLIRRLEVLHGPASALYGSSAIGGVVAATTPDPADIAGSYGGGGDVQVMHRLADESVHGVGLTALQHGNAGVLLGGSYRDGNEQPSAAVEDTLDTRAFRRRAALAKLVYEDQRGDTWRLSVMHQDAEVDSDLRSFLGAGRYRSTTALLGDDRYRMQMVSGSWEFGDAGGIVDDGVVRAYYQQALTRQATVDERGLASRPVSIDRYFEFGQDIRGVEVNVYREVEAGGLRHRLGAGLEYRERRSEEFRDGLETGIDDGVSSPVILGEAFPLRDFPRSTTREWGAFLADDVVVGDWTFIAGLRMDRYELSPQDDPMFAEDYPFAQPVAVSESDVSPKVAVMYQHGDGLDVYLQYARGFRAPPYEDANIGLDIPVFNYRAVPNPDLESETSDGVELGLRLRTGPFSLRAAAFRTDYDNFIESRARIGVDPVSGRILFQARNLDSARIEGVELGWDWNPGGVLRDVVVDGSLYRARGRNDDDGQPLNTVGPAQAVLGLGWTQPDGRRSLRLQATATAAWDRRDESRGPLFKPAGHAVIDLYYMQRVGDRLTLRAAVQNAADRTWWHWSGVSGLADGDILISHIAQPGRSVTVGAQYHW